MLFESKFKAFTVRITLGITSKPMNSYNRLSITGVKPRVEWSTLTFDHSRVDSLCEINKIPIRRQVIMSMGDDDNSVHVSLAFSASHISEIFSCAFLVIFTAYVSLWFQVCRKLLFALMNYPQLTFNLPFTYFEVLLSAIFTDVLAK